MREVWISLKIKGLKNLIVYPYGVLKFIAFRPYQGKVSLWLFLHFSLFLLFFNFFFQIFLGGKVIFNF